MPHNRKQRILIIDDDTDILELLKYNLIQEGYDVYTEKRAEKSLGRADKLKPDLIILDIMMPEINGLEICTRLRRREYFRDIFIFFLTAKSEKYLQLEAFRRGGDDYIEKITGLRALTHKVGSVLKNDLVIRKWVPEITLKSMRIDREKSAVIYKSRLIPLSTYEFELLYLFAQNPGKVITRESLINNIWGSDIYMLPKSVDNYIKNICSKLNTSAIALVRENNYRLNINALS
jgi:two-component system alkaline phosphatase synthesis response regulator PhoP